MKGYAEPFEIAGITVRDISPVDIPPGPLDEEIRSYQEDSEDYELQELKIPGDRKRAYLLYRPYVGQLLIAWGSKIYVRGYYTPSDGVRMFSQRIDEEKKSEGVEVDEQETRRRELLSLKHGLGANQKLPVTLEAELKTLQDAAARQKRLTLAEGTTEGGNEMETKRRGGRPKGSKNKPKNVAPLPAPRPAGRAGRAARAAATAGNGKRRGRVPRTYTVDQAMATLGIDRETLDWLVEEEHVRYWEDGLLYAREVDGAYKYLEMEEGEATDEAAEDPGGELPFEVEVPAGLYGVQGTTAEEAMLPLLPLNEAPMQERVMVVPFAEPLQEAAARDGEPQLTPREVKVVRAFVGLIDALFGRG